MQSIHYIFLAYALFAVVAAAVIAYKHGKLPRKSGFRINQAADELDSILIGTPMIGGVDVTDFNSPNISR